MKMSDSEISDLLLTLHDLKDIAVENPQTRVLMLLSDNKALREWANIYLMTRDKIEIERKKIRNSEKG